MVKDTVKEFASKRKLAKSASHAAAAEAAQCSASGQGAESEAGLIESDTLGASIEGDATLSFEVRGSEAFECTVPARVAPVRLDVFLAQQLGGLSRSFVQQLIAKNLLTLGGQLCVKPARKVVGGEQLRLVLEVSAEANAYAPQDIALDVIFEDDHLAVMLKPAGLVVHPGAGNWSGTLLNGLLHRYPASAELPRAGIVHRLDKDTSGLMVVAKSRTAYTALVAQIAERAVSRQYLAVVHGLWAGAAGKRSLRCIDVPIGRDQANRLRMAVADNKLGKAKGADPTHAKPAQTDFVCLARCAPLPDATASRNAGSAGFSLLQAKLHTGRTHQIRVHAAYCGHPLVGDVLYGGLGVDLKDNTLSALRVGVNAPAEPPDAPVFKRQALHAAYLAFTHPITQAPLRFEATLPDDLRALCATLNLKIPAFAAL